MIIFKLIVQSVIASDFFMTAIRNHLLYDENNRPVPFRATPNLSDRLQAEYIVIHYADLPNAETAIDRLTDPESGVSAHLVIARDGAITQLAPFDRATWHAGVSAWNGRENLNRFSIGIELDNAGRLIKKAGRWTDRLGNAYPEEEITEAVHRLEKTPSGWHIYPEVQLRKLAGVVKALIRAYPLKAILGHDDISPDRKTDPGPAFPMARFRRIFHDIKTGSAPPDINEYFKDFIKNKTDKIKR